MGNISILWRPWSGYSCWITKITETLSWCFQTRIKKWSINSKGTSCLWICCSCCCPWSFQIPTPRFVQQTLPYLLNCKKQQKKDFWPVTGLRNRGTLKNLNDSKLIVYESKWFPWPSRINFIPFRIFRGPLFHKPVTGQELFFLLFLTANRL